jgi:hypothetical protein
MHLRVPLAADTSPDDSCEPTRASCVTAFCSGAREVSLNPSVRANCFCVVISDLSRLLRFSLALLTRSSSSSSGKSARAAGGSHEVRSQT